MLAVDSSERHTRPAGHVVAMELEGVAIGFASRLVAQDINAVFPAGSVTALVGPSGSGKTTLLAVMAGYLEPLRGSAAISFRDGTRGNVGPQYVSWVPQGANALGARSAVENVAIAAMSTGLSLPESHEVARECLAAVGLGDREADMARTLSGGEVQRLAFARALACRRPALFADEPTASLDAANTQRIATLLAGLSPTGVVVVATHDPVLVAAADRTVTLRGIGEEG